jgi:CheY-like chemotaxis protein
MPDAPSVIGHEGQCPEFVLSRRLSPPTGMCCSQSRDVMNAALESTVFTTGDVARICQVAPRTVSKWFDTGRLKGYRIPGSLDRRIPRDSLIEFMRSHGMPLGELGATQGGKVLIIGMPAIEREIVEKLLLASGMTITCAVNAFEAGALAMEQRPQCVVIDASIGSNEARMIANYFKIAGRDTSTRVVGLISDDEIADPTSAQVYDEKFRRPFDPALLAVRVKSLTEKVLA